MKIFLDTIGCRLNQAELEQMARQFRSAGHEIVASASLADLAVINTCTVTSAAASDSRAAIRRAARQGVRQIAATGCWATLEPEAASALPGVTSIIPNPQKDTLAAELLGLPPEYFDLEPLARQPLPGLHARTRAFIKVQDGCDNACTFCITTQARGAARFRPLDDVLGDVNFALAGGSREIVLTGVHLGAWGQDLSTPRRLAHLVSTLLSNASIPRLRLSSLEPWDLDADFFQLWESPALCRHLHLPLQSGSAGVLKRMRRKSSAEDFAALVSEARHIIPQVAITTDLIAGFPGETEAEFSETLDFVNRMQFAAGHVFTYSSRPGTPAARLPAQVDSKIAHERSARLRLALAHSAQAYRFHFIGETLSVLWESTSRLSDSGWRMEGLTDNYLRLTALAPQPRWNQVDTVKITGMDEENLTGTILGIPEASPA